MSQKAKNQAILQAQQSYLSKHINSNGPNSISKKKPLDFESFDQEVLIKYNQKFNLNFLEPISLNDDILNSEIGKKTLSRRIIKNQNDNRITKSILANHLKSHFTNFLCKENEIITNFLHYNKYQNNAFKLSYK